MNKPLLLLDVDGPLNPFEPRDLAAVRDYEPHWIERWEGYGDFRLWLNPAHGPQLLALPYDLVWATTWMDRANEAIGPNIGLPELPVIEWANAEDGGYACADGLYFKTPEIVDWMPPGQPFAWVDDEITEKDVAYVAEHHDGPALLHHVDPGLGLREDDFSALKGWAVAISQRMGG